MSKEFGAAARACRSRKEGSVEEMEYSVRNLWDQDKSESQKRQMHKLDMREGTLLRNQKWEHG